MNKSLQFLIYDTPQANVKVDVVVKDETKTLNRHCGLDPQSPINLPFAA
ncbi:MAG: hypothetical protein LBM07_05295 [Culturomica sp.]|jgi:hypothetical protein|nr:hypothetical protein [Culturomica sp.]